jgi:hypothetical protein
MEIKLAYNNDIGGEENINIVHVHRAHDTNHTQIMVPFG